eukprot:737056-Pleurochrysis_carterae.AAC.6
MSTNGRGKYGCASDECKSGDGSLLIRTRPDIPTSAQLHRREREGEPSGSGRGLALRGINSTHEQTAQTAKMHKYQ